MAISRIALIALIALAASLCAGCDGTQERTAYVPPRVGASGTIHTDVAYMQRVEDQARTRGIEVTWINPPMKRTDPTSAPTPR